MAQMKIDFGNEGPLQRALTFYFYRAIFFENFVKVQIFIFIFFVLVQSVYYLQITISMTPLSIF